MIRFLIIAFFIGVLAGIALTGWLQGRKIDDLYAEIDYLKRTGEGFINEPVEEG